MTIKFAQLATELQLTPTYQNAAQLLAIKQWCINHISSDIKYTGNNAEQYNLYVDLIKNYVNVFLPQIKHNFSTINPTLDNLNAVQYAALHGYDIFISNNKFPIALLDIENANKMSPLHLAGIAGYVNTTKALLKQGANPLKQNGHGQLPIQSVLLLPIFADAALKKQKETTFRVLFAQSAESIAHKDNDGDTAVHQLAAGGYDELLAEILLHNQNSAFYHNNHIRYPIHTAILNNKSSAANLLLAIDKVEALEDAKMRTALHYAACYGTKEMLEICYKATSDINHHDTEGKTPLKLAREAKKEENAQFLIENGAYENSQYNNY